MEFPEKYFEKEKRDGFDISEVMKRNWASQTEVLKTVERICDKYGIRYYAYFGTLLGAIRHNGFIPWDDDIDIVMPGEDYVRFLEIAQSEMPEEYWLLNMYTEKDRMDVFTRLVNRRSINLLNEKSDNNHGCPFSVGIDIFPLYSIPDDNDLRNEQLELIRTISSAVCHAEAKNEKTLKEFLEFLTEYTGFEFERNGDRTIQNQLTILYDQAGRLYLDTECKSLTYFYISMNHEYSVERDMFEPAIDWPFENTTIRVPKEYDAILKKSFGPNYMVPRRYTLHDYPSYSSQAKEVGDRTELNDLAYKQKTANIRLTIDENKSSKYKDYDSVKDMIPKEWLDKLFFKNDNGEYIKKKVILYYTGATELIKHCEHLEEKIGKNMEIFKNNPEVVCWWFPCDIEDQRFPFIEAMMPNAVREYAVLKEKFESENFGILDESGDLERAFNISDAYFGDESLFSEYYKKAKKPMMIQDYDI